MFNLGSDRMFPVSKNKNSANNVLGVKRLHEDYVQSNLTTHPSPRLLPSIFIKAPTISHFVQALKKLMKKAKFLCCAVLSLSNEQFHVAVQKLGFEKQMCPDTLDW